MSPRKTIHNLRSHFLVAVTVSHEVPSPLAAESLQKRINPRSFLAKFLLWRNLSRTWLLSCAPATRETPPKHVEQMNTFPFCRLCASHGMTLAETCFHNSIIEVSTLIAAEVSSDLRTDSTVTTTETRAWSLEKTIHMAPVRLDRRFGLSMTPKDWLSRLSSSGTTQHAASHVLPR